MLKAEKPKQKNNKIWLISILSTLIISGGMIWYNRIFPVTYYVNWKYNNLKARDKLYSKYHLNHEPLAPGSYNLSLSRKIRPLSSNPSGKSYMMMMCAWSINGDSLYKYKTTYIGIYTGAEIYGIKSRDKDTYASMLFYSINPNKKVLFKDVEDDITKLPAVYEFDEGPFYVMSFEVTDKLTKSFILSKKKIINLKSQTLLT